MKSMASKEKKERCNCLLISLNFFQYLCLMTLLVFYIPPGRFSCLVLLALAPAIKHFVKEKNDTESRHLLWFVYLSISPKCWSIQDFWRLTLLVKLLSIRCRLLEMISLLTSYGSSLSVVSETKPEWQMYLGMQLI